MATVTFDTLKFVKTLEAAGIPFLQAEALSDAVRESHEGADVATKHDVDDVKRDIDDVRKDMHAMEARIDAKFERFELRLTVKLGGIVVFALGALTVLPKWVA